MCIAKLNIFYQHDATIINSNCLLFILKVLKAHFNILSLSHLCNKFCYSIIEPHHSLIFYLFFSLLNFSSHYLKKKKKNNNNNNNNKNHLLVHTYNYTFFNLFLSLFASLPPPLLFTSLLHFLHYFFLLII